MPLRFEWVWKGGGGEPPPAPQREPTLATDPALAWARLFVLQGRIEVEGSENVLYRLERSADQHRPIQVFFRKKPERTWYALNPGWELPHALTYDYNTRQRVAPTPEFQEAAALAIVQVILDGWPLYQLVCGRLMDHDYYSPHR